MKSLLSLKEAWNLKVLGYPQGVSERVWAYPYGSRLRALTHAELGPYRELCDAPSLTELKNRNRFRKLRFGTVKMFRRLAKGTWTVECSSRFDPLRIHRFDFKTEMLAQAAKWTCARFFSLTQKERRTVGKFSVSPVWKALAFKIVEKRCCQTNGPVR